MIKRVNFATVYVSDQDRAISFFRDKLGFEVRRDDPFGDLRWVEVGQPGDLLSLALITAGWGEDEGEGGAVDGGKVGGGSGIGFVTDDMMATYRQLTAAGVSFTLAPVDHPYGMVAMFSDEDGNIFALNQLNSGSQAQDTKPHILTRRSR